MLFVARHAADVAAEAVMEAEAVAAEAAAAGAAKETRPARAALAMMMLRAAVPQELLFGALVMLVLWTVATNLWLLGYITH